ncbi:pyridine nucleotide-disulfide oxidoreductase [Pseudoxanthomonas kalamensis DSM 18571]|uniref:FAD/NAD(P)-binding protein n=1 Tax=Pseudoxanthomonas kalamensis TaxID=289483 RepID=UPI00139194B3|nr:FAD/NAD(P)-binding protein [Pseudoxanthomonas kalamensis]KAF1712263.1 pyridine nucleotide-disulfide oxidoreductase [Pseudoxanthomonas kalamensis DSM 18571]
MPESADDSIQHDLAIAGGGAGGTLLAIQLLRQAVSPLRIALIEPAAQVGDGVAYATRHPGHVLNVPARGMSAFASQPDDFVDFLAGPGGDRDALAATYVERRRYGEYLRMRLQQARQSSPARLQVVQARAVSIAATPAGWRMTLADGTTVQARAVALAVGNAPRPFPASGASSLPAGRCIAAWDTPSLAKIDPDADVCIAGAGLSMVDAVLALVANSHRGRIRVLSRHALAPLPHAACAPATFDPSALLAMTLQQRWRALRGHVRDAAQRGEPWQSVFERLRPHGQALWRSLSATDQRRFLRHAVRYWDVPRHRIAPQVHAQLSQLRERGQLQLQRGRINAVAMAGNRVRVSTRSAGRIVEFDADVLLNATGVEMQVAAMGNPLLDDLLGHDHAVAGPHGIGIATDDTGRVLAAGGRAYDDLFALGSLRIGTLWESLAIPELRGQAGDVAASMLQALTLRQAGTLPAT